jgi:hypothetical protein
MYFRRLLERLQHELDVLANGERPHYELMLDILAYLREFCDRVLQLPLARLAGAPRHRACRRELRQHLTAVLEDAIVPRSSCKRRPPLISSISEPHRARERRGPAAHRRRTHRRALDKRARGRSARRRAFASFGGKSRSTTEAARRAVDPDQAAR